MRNIAQVLFLRAGVQLEPLCQVIKIMTRVFRLARFVSVRCSCGFCCSGSNRSFGKVVFVRLQDQKGRTRGTRLRMHMAGGFRSMGLRGTTHSRSHSTWDHPCPHRFPRRRRFTPPTEMNLYLGAANVSACRVWHACTRDKCNLQIQLLLTATTHCSEVVEEETRVCRNL